VSVDIQTIGVGFETAGLVKGQQALDAFVPLVKAAIEADKSLGGAAQSLQCQSMSGYAPLSVGDVTYLSASFAVRVIATA